MVCHFGLQRATEFHRNVGIKKEIENFCQSVLSHLVLLPHRLLQFPFSYERSKISIALRNNCCIEPIVVILEIDSSLSRVFKTRKFVPSYKIISVNRYFDLTFLFQLEKEDDIEPQFR